MIFWEGSDSVVAPCLAGRSGRVSGRPLHHGNCRAIALRRDVVLNPFDLLDELGRRDNLERPQARHDPPSRNLLDNVHLDPATIADAPLKVVVHLIDARSVSFELGGGQRMRRVVRPGTGVEGVEGDAESVKEGLEEGRTKRRDSDAVASVRVSQTAILRQYSARLSSPAGDRRSYGSASATAGQTKLEYTSLKRAHVRQR